MYCSPAAKFDSDQSELLDDYLLQLARFHFVWNAFELASKCLVPKRVVKCKDSEVQRSYIQAVPIAHRKVMENVSHVCVALAKGDASFRKPIKEVDGSYFLGQVAQNMKIFRNHVFHGHENLPEPDDLTNVFKTKLDGKGILSVQSYRVILFTRLTLHMIQALAHTDLKRNATVPVSCIQFLTSYHDYEFDFPCKFALNLASSWSQKDESRPCAQAIESLAADCDVPQDIREIICSH